MIDYTIGIDSNDDVIPGQLGILHTTPSVFLPFPFTLEHICFDPEICVLLLVRGLIVNGRRLDGPSWADPVPGEAFHPHAAGKLNFDTFKQDDVIQIHITSRAKEPRRFLGWLRGLRMSGDKDFDAYL